MRRAEVAFAGVLVALAAAAALGVLESDEAGIAGGAGMLVVAFVTGIFVGRRVRSWGYCERSGDLLVRRGLLIQRLTVVPYGRMQLVDVTAGAAERIFGLRTVRLHTAAAATDARLPGLVPSEADRLRDRLALLGETQAAGV
jgi:membrane protein YdbS with pleckstrin-like domain